MRKRRLKWGNQSRRKRKRIVREALSLEITEEERKRKLVCLFVCSNLRFRFALSLFQGETKLEITRFTTES